MSTEDPALFEIWIRAWSDLARFEIDSRPHVSPTRRASLPIDCDGSDRCRAREMKSTATTAPPA